MNGIVLNDYGVNPSTMSILPYEYKSNLYSKVYEENNSLIVRKSPFEIIDSSCEQFGSSYDGRLKGTKCLTGIKIKSPIIINPHLPIYAFPTRSAKSAECGWIITRHIKTFYDGEGKNETVLLMSNDQPVTISIASRGFDQQILRTAALHQAYEKQVKKQEEYVFMSNLKKYLDQEDKIKLNEIVKKF